MRRVLITFTLEQFNAIVLNITPGAVLVVVIACARDVSRHAKHLIAIIIMIIIIIIILIVMMIILQYVYIVAVLEELRQRK